jgi:hypothetical protein
VSFTML